MTRTQLPQIDFSGWRRRRRRCQRPPLRRRPPGTAGAIVTAVAATAVLSVPPAAAQVRIQEVLYDAAGTDATGVFTELSGPPDTALDGWSLVGVNGGSGTSYRTVDLSGAAIPADGILVIATDQADAALAAVRDLVGSVDWQNGPDAVQLLDGDDRVVDALQYGDAGAFNAGEGTPAPTTPAGQSLSRDADGTDTGDNAADFSVLEVPTPGTGPPAGTPVPGSGFTVSLPDTTATGGATLAVPVRFTDSGQGGVVAAELFVSYDGDLLSPVDVKPAGLLDPRQWQLASNTLEGAGTAVDTLRIAMATDVDALSGDGTLVQARFVIADLRRPAATALTIEHLALNDGGVAAVAEDGAVTLVGSEARTVTTPARIVMHDYMHIAVTDPDVNRDPETPDTLDILLGEGPAHDQIGEPDTLEAVETGPSSGTFAGRVAILYEDPDSEEDAASGGDAVETVPGHLIQLCFDDSLDAAGVTTRRCTLLAVPAHDGRLDATVVAQPGDTLWMRLIDADGNRRPAAVDTAFVTTTNGTSTRTVSLVETSLSDSVFFGHLVTAAKEAEAGLAVAGGDSLRPAYRDLHTTGGREALVADTTLVLGLFGDADANALLQAFDASRILNHVLAPLLAERDSLAANVDSLAPFGAITPYDAALVLQQRVGLRRRFPVQESVAANHPRSAPETSAQPSAPEAGRPLAAERRLELRHRSDHLALWLDERSGIVAGDVLLQWEEEVRARLEPSPDLRGFLVASGPAPGPRGPHALRVVLAGARPASGPGELFRIHPLGGTGLAGAAAVAETRFNDGRIPVRVAAPPPASSRPGRFALHANHPNPFNAGTVIPFELAEAGPVRLTVVNLVGQEVRRLVQETRRAGAHRVRWDGRDEEGRPAATGVYLMRLQAGASERTRRMLLLR